MPTIEAIAGASDPIKMCFFKPPSGAVESQRIYRRGVATTRDGIVIDGIPQSPKDEVISIQIAKEHSFGFVEMWGRKAGNSTVIACLSNWLVGFDGTDPVKQRECGLAILERIAGIDTRIVDYGEHKSVAFLETDLDAETMVRRVLDSQTELIGESFPRYAGAQAGLTITRSAQLIDLQERKPFVDIFEGEVSALKRPWEDNDNEYYEWGWGKKGDNFVAISQDNTEYTLDMLIATATVAETGQTLKDIGDFLKGEYGRNRFAIQLDFGEDASCSNTAINAQKDTSGSIFGSDQIIFGSALQITTESPTIQASPAFYPGWIHEQSKEYCQKCKKNTSENKCDCKKESN